MVRVAHYLAFVTQHLLIALVVVSLHLRRERKRCSCSLECALLGKEIENGDWVENSCHHKLPAALWPQELRKDTPYNSAPGISGHWY